ncbi:hypothetical protein B0H14DRAFT_3899384 [Mycena olivaceomarginata]|nr:hypothetical protein B0H14DRAFT_3899384 [Mycena olivaceomarginata]
MYAEAGCTEAGRCGYSSTEVASRRGASRFGRTLCDVRRRIWSQGGATSKRPDVLARERFHRLFCWGLGAEFFLPESAHRPGPGTVGVPWLWGGWSECEDVKEVGGWGYRSFGAGRLAGSSAAREPSRIRADQRFRIHIRLPAHVAVPLHTPLVPVLVPLHSEPTGWTIWSRRLRDPAHAPGVIISSRAAAARHRGVHEGRGGPPLSPPPVLAEQEREEGGAEEAVVEREAPVPILHVKGFCYDTAVGGIAKVGKRVAFGPELGVGDGSRMSLLKLSFDTGSELIRVPPRRLFVGGTSSIPRGFPAVPRAPGASEGWVRIDDKLVSDVRSPDVFGAPERDSQYAYLLFYRRVR